MAISATSLNVTPFGWVVNADSVDASGTESIKAAVTGKRHLVFVAVASGNKVDAKWVLKTASTTLAEGYMKDGDSVVLTPRIPFVGGDAEAITLDVSGSDDYAAATLLGLTVPS